MVDTDLVLAKAGAVKRHLDRIQERLDADFESFEQNEDRQDIVLFNLQLAIRNCIDIAAHIVSQECAGIPGSYSEILYLLEENNYITKEITEKMVKAIGFRNLMVHEYANIELKIVFEIAKSGPKDIKDYLQSVLLKIGLT